MLGFVSYWCRLRAKLRYSGPLRLLFDGMSRLGVHIVLYYLMAEDCDAQAPLVEGGREFRVLPIQSEYLPRLAQLPGASRTLPQLEKLYAEGKRGILLLDGDEIAAHTWVDLEQCNFSGFRFDLPPDAAYLFDAYTHPKYRGAGLAPYLRSRLYRDLAASGRRRLYSVSVSHNRPAMRFKAKLGARLVHLGVFVRLFGRFEFSGILRRYPSASAPSSARYAR